jgi:hypothetical protein
MYPGVPNIAELVEKQFIMVDDVEILLSMGTSLASPQSMSLTVKPSARQMLALFMSRWKSL